MSRPHRRHDAPTHRHGRDPRSRGFSLIELMIATTIGLGLLAALVTLTVRNARATAEREESSRQVENGRYAIEMLAEEIQLAGYYGALAPRSAARTRPDACATALSDLGWNPAPYSVPVAVEGYDAGLAAPGCYAAQRPDTGAIAVRRVGTQPLGAAAVSAANAHLQTSQCEDDPATTPFVFSDEEGDFTLRNLACNAPALVNRYVSRGYYVADCDECGRDTVPTLKRVELLGGAIVVTPVAEGIEELQFEYGFDVDGDGIPDQFRTRLDGIAGSATNAWENVMAVRIRLIARTVEATPGYADAKTYDLGPHGTRGPYGDGFKRRLYTTLVRLNNPAGLRQ